MLLAEVIEDLTHHCSVGKGVKRGAAVLPSSLIFYWHWWVLQVCRHSWLEEICLHQDGGVWRSWCATASHCFTRGKYSLLSLYFCFITICSCWTNGFLLTSLSHGIIKRRRGGEDGVQWLMVPEWRNLICFVTLLLPCCITLGKALDSFMPEHSYL